MAQTSTLVSVLSMIIFMRPWGLMSLGFCGAVALSGASFSARSPAGPQSRICALAPCWTDCMVSTIDISCVCASGDVTTVTSFLPSSAWAGAANAVAVAKAHTVSIFFMGILFHWLRWV